MNDVKFTTHIESLDSDQVSIPDLDVEGALASTIVRGKKIAHRRKVTRVIQGAAAFLIVAIVAVSAVQILGESSPTKVATKNLDKVPTKVKAKQETQTSVTAPISVPAQTPVTPTPRRVSILSYGNSALCTIAPTQDGTGVMIGPSQNIQKWNPAVNETGAFEIGPSGHMLYFKNTQSTDATNGQYASLESGYDRSNSYANVTTLGATYCENGFKLTITPENDGGYLLSMESR